MNKNKEIIIIIIITGIFFILMTMQCNEFPVDYERVDTDMVRILDYVYKPAEAAPGDTVYLKAVFAGKQIELQNISWKISHNILMNNYDTDTAYTIKPIDAQIIPTPFSSHTYCVGMKLVIPLDIMYQSSMIPENWTTKIEELDLSAVEIPIAGKSAFLPLLDTLACHAAQWEKAFSQRVNNLVEDSLSMADPYFLVYNNELKEYLPSLLQIFTVKMRIITDVNGFQKIKSDYSVRYNSKFSGLPQSNIYKNTNPVIDSIGVYIVKEKGRVSYNPAENIHDFVRLLGPSDTLIPGYTSGDSVRQITVNTNYSYFFAAFNNNVDSTVTIESALNGAIPTLEDHRAQWYFQVNTSETQGVSGYDYMDIGNHGNLITPFSPPKDNRLQSFTLWCELYDYKLNELFRPVGSALKEVYGKFVY